MAVINRVGKFIFYTAPFGTKVVLEFLCKQSTE